MARFPLPAWAEAFQLALSALFALSPAIAVAYVQFRVPAAELFVAHTAHEVAIALAVVLALFQAHLAYRCHRDSGEPLTRQLALGFFGFAVLYAPHGVLTFAAHDLPVLFLLWGPAARLVLAFYVLRGLLAPRGVGRTAPAQGWRFDMILLAATAGAVGALATLRPDWFPAARMAIEAAAGLISLGGLAVLVATRVSGPILWFHAVALTWFAVASGAFLLAKPWNTQWWLAHAVSAAGFLLLGWGVAQIFRTSQSFVGAYSPERMFGLLSNATRIGEELRQAKEAADRSVQTKATFLAAASHDLRQPAQAMMLFSGALRARLDAGHPAAAILPHLEAATMALQSILDGLLDVSRLDAGMVSAQPANLPVAPLLVEAVDQARSRAAAKQLTLQAEDCHVAVHADRALLRRLVANLVDNAIKYTPRGGVVLDARDLGTTVRIRVSDTGPGVPPDQQDAIFEEFVQLENPERDRTKGLGLGLAIVRRLATLMDGRVGVDSRPGGGSTFWVELPASTCPPAP